MTTESQSDPADDPEDAEAAAAAELPRPPIDTVEARLERVERERGEVHDRMLRVAADFENYKKRARRESDEAANRGREALLKELLPVLDNVERALVALGQGGTIEALGEGVRLVEKQVHTVLEKFDVRRFDALGQVFDPAKHEAIQQIESAAVAPGAVAMVFARGYLIGDRLLRPAMVAVAKAPARPVAESADADAAAAEAAAAEAAAAEAIEEENATGGGDRAGE